MRTTPEHGVIYTVDEIAEKANVGSKTIRRAIQKSGPGNLAHLRIGRIIRVSETQYQDWLRRSEVKASF